VTQSLLLLSEAIALGFAPQWIASVEGDVLLSRTGRGEILRVVVARDGKPLYDQWVAVEPIGAATAPIDKNGRLGLVQVWRPVASATDPVIPWQVDVRMLGRLCWEIPRGFPEVGEQGSETALREGGEEMGRHLSGPVCLGRYNANSTFFVNSIPLWTARVAGSGEVVAGDPNERILRASFFTTEKVGRMLDSGDLEDGFTLAALTYLGRRGLFRL